MPSLLLVFVSVCPLSAEPQKSGDCVNTWSKGVVGGACVATSPVDISYSSVSSLPTNSPPVALRHKHATHVDTYMHKSVITDDVWCTDLQAYQAHLLVCTPAYQKMAASVSLNNFEYNIFQTSYTAVVSHTHTLAVLSLQWSSWCQYDNSNRVPPSVPPESIGGNKDLRCEGCEKRSEAGRVETKQVSRTDEKVHGKEKRSSWRVSQQPGAY